MKYRILNIKVYEIVERSLTLMFDDFLNLNLIKKDETYYKLIIENILFFTWELEMRMYECYQTK